MKEKFSTIEREFEKQSLNNGAQIVRDFLGHLDSYLEDIKRRKEEALGVPPPGWEKSQRVVSSLDEVKAASQNREHYIENIKTMLNQWRHRVVVSFESTENGGIFIDKSGDSFSYIKGEDVRDNLKEIEEKTGGKLAGTLSSEEKEKLFELLGVSPEDGGNGSMPTNIKDVHVVIAEDQFFSKEQPQELIAIEFGDDALVKMVESV